MAAKLPFLQPTHTPLPAFEFQRSQFPYYRQNLHQISTTTRIKSVPGDQSSSSFSLSRNFFLSPSLPKTSDSSRPFTVKSQLNFPLISPNDKWGTWTALFATGAFGIWLERTKIRSALSGVTVSILIGLAASNSGIIPYKSPAYSIVPEFLLPLAVSSLFFRADSRQSTWKLLLASFLGSVATIVGTVLAYLMVPMRSLGRDSWKIAAALMGRHIGGAANYVATADRLRLSSSALAAGLAADNVIYAVQFAILFALASKIPPESSASTNDVSVDEGSNCGDKRPVLLFATALAVAFAICKAGAYLTKYFGIQGASLPAITAVAVILATALPTQFNKLAPSGEAMALVLIQIFFAVVGARAHIWTAIKTAPSIFLFALVQLTVRLALILGLGKLFRFDRKLLLLASNVGDSTAACGMATAKGWSSLIVPAILAGFFGNGIRACLGLFFGDLVLDVVYFMRVMRNIIDLICTIFRIA